MGTQATAPGITPRAPRFAFDTLPRHWFADNPFATQMANGVNLLFPLGERFFVRSVKRYLDEIHDDTLRAEVKAFFSQEGQHANAHERFFRTLEAQGYSIRRFLEIYEAIAWKGAEPLVSPEVRLAITVALEHFTAIMAENALRDRIVEHAHPTMRALLLWHAAEEIEHKSVAFDVLRAVNPSYRVRMKGLALATVGLAGFWLAATSMLLWQDWKRGERDLFRHARQIKRQDPVAKRVFVRGVREFIRRDFHPTENDTASLAQAYLAEAGLT